MDGKRMALVWIEFKHRLEDRPFIGVGDTFEDAIEDAWRIACLNWGLGETRMGLVEHVVVDFDMFPQVGAHVTAAAAALKDSIVKTDERLGA